MPFISNYKVFCTLTTLFFTLLSVAPPAWTRSPPGPPPISSEAREVLKRIKTAAAVSIEDFEAFSLEFDESKQMLKTLQTGVDAYNATLKSGEIEFTITLHRKQEPDTFADLSQFLENRWAALRNRKPAEKAPVYEDVGYWHITYKFNGDTQFFDVKARKKREITGGAIFRRAKNGSPYTAHNVWWETHHQYLIDKDELYIRDGATWKPYTDLPAAPAFNERFNPRWWIAFSHTGTFEKFMHPYKPVRVQTVEIDGTSLLYVQAHRRAIGDGWRPYTTWTREIWVDPQKDFHVIRMVTCERGASFSPDEGSFWPLRAAGEVLGMGVRCDIKTYQLTQYEPGVWFPKIVTEEEKDSGIPIYDLFPNTPYTEYPPIVLSFLNDTRLPEWFEERANPAPTEKKTMEVHRAVFNSRVSIPDPLP